MIADMLFSTMMTPYRVLIGSKYSWDKIKLTWRVLLTKENSVDRSDGINTMLLLSNGKLAIIIQNFVAVHVLASLKKEGIHRLSGFNTMVVSVEDTYCSGLKISVISYSMIHTILVKESLKRYIGNIEGSKKDRFQRIQIGRCSFHRSVYRTFNIFERQSDSTHNNK